MVGFTPTPTMAKGMGRLRYLPYPKILWPPFRLFAYCHGRLTRSSDYGYPLICNNLPWHGTRTLTIICLGALTIICLGALRIVGVGVGVG